MARAKKSNILSDFYRDSEPDAERLAELVNKARGKRSVTEFARLCGVSPSTISRLGRAQNNTPSSDNLIVEIAINADKDSGVSFQDLVNAHGMHLIREEYYDSDVIAARYQEVFDRIVKEMESDEFQDQRSVSRRHNYDSEVERRVREIISNDLLELGYSVALDLEQSRPCSTFDFVFKTNALEEEGLSSWGFDIKTRRLIYRNYFERLFAYAYTNKPRKRGQRITIVVTDYDMYTQIKSWARKYCIDDSISIMYVDIDEGCVAAEYVLRTNGDVNTVKLFDKEGNNNV